jgi:hypothetical protein
MCFTCMYVRTMIQEFEARAVCDMWSMETGGMEACMHTHKITGWTLDTTCWE